MTPRHADLYALLTAHTPRDREEAGHLRRMRRLCESSDDRCDPFARDHFNPGHFTASAFIVSPEADAVLLIFHAKLERWLQPGGHVEPTDATIREAARREVREEVGMDLTLVYDGLLDLDVHDIPALKGDPAHAHFDVRFAFHAQDRAFRTASDAEAGRWASWAELDEKVSDRSVMRAVDKLRALGPVPIFGT